MVSRCRNPNDPSYPRYGGREIKVCKEWEESFLAFISYVGARPEKNLSIDRFPDNNGNYEPGNVRWATSYEQNQNTSRNKIVAINDDNLVMSSIARSKSINQKTFAARVRKGWDQDRLLMEAGTAGTSKAQKILYNGEELTVKQWSKRLNMHHKTFSKRLLYGWSIEKIMNRPVTKNRHLRSW